MNKGFSKFHPILFLIIILYLINGIYYLKSQSITSDEGAFYDYAKRFLKGNPDRVDPRSDNSKTPIVILNTIPRIVTQILVPETKKSDWGVSDITNGRYTTLLISVLTILLVYSWTAQLYGAQAGIFSALLMSLCPNNLANAALVTTDSYSALFLVAPLFYLWKFYKYNKKSDFILFCVCVAFAQLVKQSLFHLYVIIPLLLILLFLCNPEKIKRAVFLKGLLFFILINWLVINAGYYFFETNTLLGNYTFKSELFNTVQRYFPSSFPVPFPKPFVDGLDMTKYYDQIGGGYTNISSFGKVTILNQSSTGGSFWYYYFVTIFFKTPISFLIFFLAAIAITFSKATKASLFSNNFFLLFPVIYFLIIMSFFYKTQCGIRHIIFIYPLLFIFCGSIIPSAKNYFTKSVIIGLLFFAILSISNYWGNYYPYTNEFILEKKNAYKYVGAGNLEFLQGKYFFQDYMNKNKEVKMAPLMPQAGTFIITSEDYLDIWNRHEYTWLSNLKPIGHVAYNGLLIKVTENDISTKK